METKTRPQPPKKVQMIDPAAIARLLGAVQGAGRTHGVVIPQGSLAAFHHS
ncbi:MAG TPA: hypothetical protein VGS22_14610 [Thermoanaerobaculia bacterium]|jgi:hypothetical protein|nr:hypothetical protein [Thermoanaerobaculia bacterium]